MPLHLTLHHHRHRREALCEATNSLGADRVRKNGELVIDGDWFTESGITGTEQLEVTAAPSVIRLQRWEVGALEFEINHLGHRSMVAR
ncbi:TPA: hypothetical protein ACQ301_002731 [Yersinia enterocolitica]